MSLFEKRICIKLFINFILFFINFPVTSQPSLTFDLYTDSSVFFKKNNDNSDFEFARKILYVPLARLNIDGQIMKSPFNYSITLSNEDPMKTRFIFENQKDAFIDRANLGVTKAYISFGKRWKNSIGLVPVTPSTIFHGDFNPHIQNGHAQEVIGAIVPKIGSGLGWRTQTTGVNWMNIDFSIWGSGSATVGSFHHQSINNHYQLSDFDSFDKIKSYVTIDGDDEPTGASARLSFNLYHQDHLNVGAGFNICSHSLNKRYLFNIVNNIGDNTPYIDMVFNTSNMLEVISTDFTIVSGPLYFQATSAIMAIDFYDHFNKAVSSSNEVGLLLGQGNYIYGADRAAVINRELLLDKPLCEIIFRYGAEHYDQEMALLNTVDWNHLEPNLISYENVSGVEYYLIDNYRDNSLFNHQLGPLNLLNNYYAIQRKGYSFSFNTYLNKSMTVKTEYSMITGYYLKGLLLNNDLDSNILFKHHHSLSSFKTRLELSF